MPTTPTTHTADDTPAKPRAKAAGPHGVHVAYQRDTGTAVALFSSEKLALRYAVDNDLRTALVPYGTPIAAITRSVSSSGASVSTGTAPAEG